VQYIAQYYQILHPPARFRGVLRCFEVFFGLFSGRILDGWRCLKKKSFSTRKRGHYCTVLCNTPLPAPLYCLQYCAIYFPHDLLYCSKKYWQYLVRANMMCARYSIQNKYDQDGGRRGPVGWAGLRNTQAYVTHRTERRVSAPYLVVALFTPFHLFFFFISSSSFP